MEMQLEAANDNLAFNGKPIDMLTGQEMLDYMQSLRDIIDRRSAERAAAKRADLSAEERALFAASTCKDAASLVKIRAVEEAVMAEMNAH